MKIKITGRHIDVSERLKDYAEKRISKLEKYFQQLIVNVSAHKFAKTPVIFSSFHVTA